MLERDPGGTKRAFGVPRASWRNSGVNIHDRGLHLRLPRTGGNSFVKREKVVLVRAAYCSRAMLNSQLWLRLPLSQKSVRAAVVDAELLSYLC